MKQLLLLFALLAACSLGCEAPTSTESSMKKSGAAESELLAEVDKAGLESTLANNSVTLIEFTAEW